MEAESNLDAQEAPKTEAQEQAVEQFKNLSIEDKIKVLINQQAAAQEVFVKCKGAIEVLQEMLENEESEADVEAEN
jgi:hypothetical protein